MLPVHCFSTYSKQPISLPQLPCLWPGSRDGHVIKKTNTSLSDSPYFCVHAVEKDSQNYGIDPEKSREALRKLDQQLQELSKKQLSSPKIKASDVKLTRDVATEEGAEVSGSVLSYWTVLLFLLSFFYNILFYTVIKPSVDGEEGTQAPPTTIERESVSEAVLQLLPSMPEIFLQ